MMKKRRPIFFAIFLVLGIFIVVVHHCKAEGWDPNDGEPWSPPEWAESTFEPPAGTVPPSHPEPTSSPSQGNLRGASTAQPTQAPVSTPTPTDEPLDMAAPDLAYKFRTYFDIGSYNWSSSTPNRVYLTSYRNGVDSRYGDLTPWPIFTDSISTSILSTAGNFKNYYETMYSDVSMNTLSLRYNGVYVSMYLMPRGTIDNNYEMKISLLWLSSLLDLNYPSDVDDQVIYELVQPDDLSFFPIHVFCVVTTSSGRIFDYETSFVVSDLIVGVNLPIPTDQFNDNDTLASVSINLVYNWPPQSNSIIQQFNDYYTANGLTPSYYPTFNFRVASKLKVKVILEEPKEVSKNFIQKFFDSLFKPKYQNIRDIIDEYVFDPSGTSTSSDYILDFREDLYNLFSENTEDARIVIPAIDIPLPNNNTAHILDGYTFNLSEFYDGTGAERPPFATLISGVRTITSCLIGSLFFSSLWEIFVTVFGLYKWSGVYSDKEDDET